MPLVCYGPFCSSLFSWLLTLFLCFLEEKDNSLFQKKTHNPLKKKDNGTEPLSELTCGLWRQLEGLLSSRFHSLSSPWTPVSGLGVHSVCPHKTKCITAKYNRAHAHTCSTHTSVHLNTYTHKACTDMHTNSHMHTHTFTDAVSSWDMGFPSLNATDFIPITSPSHNRWFPRKLFLFCYLLCFIAFCRCVSGMSMEKSFLLLWSQAFDPAGVLPSTSHKGKAARVDVLLCVYN